jgi:hypothetical protein
MDLQILLRNVWIRSGGKCECTGNCGHHRDGRCGIQLLPGIWSLRRLIPVWAGGAGPGALSAPMVEAICEPCRLNPMPAAVAADSRMDIRL